MQQRARRDEAERDEGGGGDGEVRHSDDEMLTPTGYPPSQHSSRHGPQHTQHTASTVRPHRG